MTLFCDANQSVSSPFPDQEHLKSNKDSFDFAITRLSKMASQFYSDELTVQFNIKSTMILRHHCCSSSIPNTDLSNNFESAENHIFTIVVV